VRSVSLGQGTPTRRSLQLHDIFGSPRAAGMWVVYVVFYTG
jgi:hypothetical protein